MGLRSWTKKQAKKAKKKAKQAGKAVEKTANKAGNAIAQTAEQTAKDAGKAAEQLAKDAARETAELARKAEQALEREILSILDDAKKIAGKATGDVENLVKKVEDLGKQAVRDVQEAGKRAAAEVEKGVTEKLPDLMEAAARKLAEQASQDAAKKALNMACDIIETTAPDKYTLTFGVELALVVQGEVTVNLEIPNPVARLTEIRAWAKKPPTGRAQIIECVKDFAPESLTVEAKLSGNGGSATYSGEHILDGVDRFLAKNGVD